MFEKILFPTDFSDDNQTVLRCIGEIPGVKEVTLLHIVDATHPSIQGGTHGQHIANAKILMEEKKTYLTGLGLDVSVRVNVLQHGNVYEEILKTAERENVSLIIMGARGKGFRDVLLGSVSADVLHHTKIPLLLLRYKPGEACEDTSSENFRSRIFSKVLVPLDFSEPAGKLVSFISKVKGIDEIVLLNVIEKGKTDAETEGYVEDSRKRLEGIRGGLVRLGYKVVHHVRVGYPPDEIVSVAESEDVSLIVMSPKGKGWLRELRELFVGSTTCAVARRAHRPLLIMNAG
jgi:nucleotide-binding universal stress UspA family protein